MKEQMAVWLTHWRHRRETEWASKQGRECTRAEDMEGGRKGYLRGQPSGVVGQQGVHGGGCAGSLHHAAQVEVGHLDPPVALHSMLGDLRSRCRIGGL